MKRRNFLKLIGAVSSATFLPSCSGEKNSDKLISYLVPPEEGIIPGEASFAPSTCTECPAHCGIMVKSIDGLPKKLEGIPGHPVNDAGLCIRGQSSLYRLYHPERIRFPLLRDDNGGLQTVFWGRAVSLIADALNKSSQENLSNIYLSGRTTGFLSSWIDRFCEKMKVERVPEFEFYSHSTLKEAYRILFGQSEVPDYRIEKSDFLLTVGTDIFETFISPVSFTRRLTLAVQTPNFAWSHMEPHLSLTGTNADERLTIHPGSETYFLFFLLKSFLEQKERGKSTAREIYMSIPPISIGGVSRRTGLEPEKIDRLVRRFSNAEHPLLIAGGLCSAHESGLETAVLAGLIQWFSGSIQELVDFEHGEEYTRVGSFLDMERLSTRLKNREIGVIFISRTNPLYHLPPSYAFRENLSKSRLRVGLGDFLDETMTEADIVLPLSHSLESWGDTQPKKGLRTLIQPVVDPLYETLSEGDLLLKLMQSQSGESRWEHFEEALSDEWERKYGKEGIKTFLRHGYMEDPVPQRAPALDVSSAADFLRKWKPAKNLQSPVLIVTSSIRTFDGRSRNLPLLSEIPDPMTTISYGRWASISKGFAKKMGLKDKNEVLISSSNWSARLPVKILPGLSNETLIVQRDMLDSPPIGVERRTGEAIGYIDNIKVTRTGSSLALPILSGSMSQHGRGIIPDPKHLEKEHKHKRVSLYPEHEHKEYQWAMAIDLQRCIGCSACTAACYIENNIPLVGEKEHVRGREMSWLHIEPFYDEEGHTEFIPMLCQHCHYAPCEPVCPVFASYHNPEGLNIQVYNRCVGTRYCANNCPYKVRRFNWFDHKREKPLNKMLNPDLSVRSKGIMEKCTFCIQRIRAARDTAKDNSRKIRDGEVVTACAQSCPTEAIVFGNLLDKESRVYKLAHSDRAYRVFENLGTEPSVYYLSRRVRGI